MAVPGTYAAGQVLTAAEMNDLPGGVVDIAYAAGNEFALTSSFQTVCTETMSLSTGRLYMAFFNAYFYNNSSSGAQYTAVLQVAGSSVCGLVKDTNKASERAPFTFAYPFTVASSGATEVRIQARVNTGTGGIANGAGNQQLRMTVVDMGPTP